MDTIVQDQLITVADENNLSAPFCTPEPQYHLTTAGVTFFSLGAFSNSTEPSSAGYQDFTCSFTSDFLSGELYMMQVQSAANEFVDVWFDLDNDGYFSEDEVFYSSSEAQSVHLIDLIMPGPIEGNEYLRLRVRSSLSDLSTPCSDFQYGQVEDYRIRVIESENPPNASFEVSQNYLVASSIVQFSDLSLHNPNTWQWTFEGGSPATTTDQNPTITYDESGLYDVQLISSNEFGSDTLLLENYIEVEEYLEMCDQTITNAPEGQFYDSGGPDGSYSGNENCSLLISPECGSSSVTLTFDTVMLEQYFNDDIIRVYDGSNSSAPLLQMIDDTETPDPIVGESGELFITFESDNGSGNEGWIASWTSTPAAAADLIADFEVSSTEPAISAEVDFTNFSEGADEYYWDFGDGNYSTAEDPVHAYETPGIYEVSLTTSTCGNEDAHTVIIEVQPFPEINITPADTLHINVGCGEVVSEVFTVSNLGLGELNGEFQIDGASSVPIDPLDIVLLESPQVISTAYNNTLEVVEESLTNYEVYESSATSAAELEADIEGKDLLVLPAQSGNNYLMETFHEEIAPAIFDFVNTGGTVIVCGSRELHPIFGGGSFESSAGSYDALNIEPQHPIVNEFPIFSNGIFLYGYDLSELDNVQSLIINESEPEISYGTIQNYDNGFLVYIGRSFYNALENDWRFVLEGALEYCNEFRSANWLNSSTLDSPFTVGPNEILDIEVSADATGLSVGDYYAETIIQSNDPGNGSIPFVFHLNVAGEAELNLSDSAMSIGPIPLGTASTDTLFINNTGCDTLSIETSGLTSEVFSTDLNDLELLPYTQDTVFVSFESLSSGVFTDSLLLVSNVGNISVPITAEAIPAPDLVLNPENLFLEVGTCADSILISFDLVNEGEADLHYNLVDEFDYLPLEQMKSLMDTSYSTLTDIVPYSFFFSGGYSNYYIDNELYQWTGNRMHTNYDNNITYTNGEIEETDDFGEDSRYHTGEYPGLFCMSADMSNVDFYRVTGTFEGNNLDWDQDALELNYTNFFNQDYTGYANRIYYETSNYLESVNHIVIMQSNPEVSHTIADNSEEDHTVSGMNNVDRIYHILFSTIPSETYVNDSIYQEVFESFVDLISVPQNDPNVEGGVVQPEETFTIETYRDISQLDAGVHELPIVIHSNDPDGALDTVHVTIDIPAIACARFEWESAGDCSGQINFEDVTNNNPTSWNWDFGDGESSIQQSPSHYYSSPGEYTVTLEACNDLGCTTTSELVEVQNSHGAIDPVCSPDYDNYGADLRIIEFELNSVQNQEYDVINNYTDYSCSVQVPLTVGETYDLGITVFNSVGYWQEAFVFGWIDYNNDGHFTSEESIMYHDGFIETDYSSQFTIPADVVLNQPLRIRLKVDKSYNNNCYINDGEVEDYSVVISPTTSNAEANFSYEVSNFCEMEVQFSDYSNFGATEWEWDFGDGNTSSDQNAVHTFDSPGEYTVSLEACVAGECESTTQQVIIEEVQAADPPDCTPHSYEDLSEFHITQVSFAGVVNNSGGSPTGYEDYSCNLHYDLIAGNTYPISVVTNDNHTYGVDVWIDYNYDGNFDNNEIVFESNLWPYPGDNHSGEVTIPSDVPSIGLPLRMRVAAEPDEDNISPCTSYNSFDTEYEDYTVIISELESAPIPEFSWELVESCQGTVDFSDQSTNQATEWLWGFGDGNTSYEQQPTHLYTEAGEYEVSLEVCNEFGCNTLVQSIFIDFIEGPIDAQCIPYSEGDSESQHYITEVTINQVSNQSGASVNGYEDFSCNPAVELIAGNSYQMEIVPTYANLNYDKQVWIDYNNDGAFYDDNEYVAFIDNEYGASTFTITIPEEGIVINQPLRLRVRVAGLDESSCEDADHGEVEDYSIAIIQEAPPNADFTFEATDECQSVYQFTDVTDQVDSWQWNFGDGEISNEQNPTHNYTAGGTYNVQLIATNQFGSDTTSSEIIVPDQGLGPIEVLSNPVVDEPVTFSVIADGVQTLNWDFGDEEMLSTPLSMVEHTYSSEGIYLVSVSTDEDEVCVNAVDSLINITLTEITEADGAGDDYRIYPNPSSGEFYLVGSNLSEIEGLDVYNSIGQKVAFEVSKVEDDRIAISLSNPIPGVFFIVGYSWDGDSFRKQLVIEK